MTGNLFPDATPEDVRTEDKIAELQRELKLRRRVYPRWVADGKLTEVVAHRQILALEAMLADYERLQSEESKT